MIDVGDTMKVKTHDGVVQTGKVSRIGLSAANAWCMVEVKLPNGKPAYFPAKENEINPGAVRRSFTQPSDWKRNGHEEGTSGGH